MKESKLYPLLEALDINGPENMAENHNLHEEKNHHIISPSHQVKKCNDHCILDDQVFFNPLNLLTNFKLGSSAFEL